MMVDHRRVQCACVRLGECDGWHDWVCMFVLQIEPSESLTGKLMEELNCIAEQRAT